MHRRHEVVHTDSSLWHKVPHTCIRIRSIVPDIENRRSKRGKLVIGPEEAPRSLSPGRDPASSREVPPQDDGRNRNACIGAAGGVEG